MCATCIKFASNRYLLVNCCLICYCNDFERMSKRSDSTMSKILTILLTILISWNWYAYKNVNCTKIIKMLGFLTAKKSFQAKISAFKFHVLINELLAFLLSFHLLEKISISTFLPGYRWRLVNVDADIVQCTLFPTIYITYVSVLFDNVQTIFSFIISFTHACASFNAIRNITLCLLNVH